MQSSSRVNLKPRRLKVFWFLYLSRSMSEKSAPFLIIVDTGIEITVFIVVPFMVIWLVLWASPVGRGLAV